MRTSSVGGGRILRRTLSVCLSIRLSVRPSRARMYFVYICTVLRAHIQNGKKTSVFAYGPASRMYFSARAEGRISYGHLGRTNSCLLCFWSETKVSDQTLIWTRSETSFSRSDLHLVSDQGLKLWFQRKIKWPIALVSTGWFILSNLVALDPVAMLPCSTFSPRDAVHKSGLCCRPVSIHLYVCHYHVLYLDGWGRRQTSVSAW